MFIFLKPLSSSDKYICTSTHTHLCVHFSSLQMCSYVHVFISTHISHTQDFPHTCNTFAGLPQPTKEHGAP